MPIKWTKQDVIERINSAMSYGTGATTSAQDQLMKTMRNMRK